MPTAVVLAVGVGLCACSDDGNNSQNKNNDNENPAECGNGVIEGQEECDDGGSQAGDGCDTTCKTEHGWYCNESPSVCVTVCGDGLVAATEQCDDENSSDGDGCSAGCTQEQGFDCNDAEPTVCTALVSCGDGVCDATENATSCAEDCQCNYNGETVGLCAFGEVDSVGTCTAPIGYEEDEVTCDGDDNDCDDVTDEDCACDYGGDSDGVCADGIVSSTDGSCEAPGLYEADES